ncbi:MAG: hypothetical protein KDH88_03355 [Chromatiales bacterium]|nr:hypothetical protein [Chromatiales bacterium]
MADLFSVTAPLYIRSPQGRKHIIAELFPHPKGLVYFQPWWHQSKPGDSIHVIEGEIRGEGPWRIGDYLINVLGCQGSDPDLANEYSEWQSYLGQAGDAYPPEGLIRAIARKLGAST